LVANDDTNVRKIHRLDCAGNPGPDAVVAAKFIAIADDEELEIGLGGWICHRREMLKPNASECQQEGCSESFPEHGWAAYSLHFRWWTS